MDLNRRKIANAIFRRDSAANAAENNSGTCTIENNCVLYGQVSAKEQAAYVRQNGGYNEDKKGIALSAFNPPGLYHIYNIDFYSFGYDIRAVS